MIWASLYLLVFKRNLLVHRAEKFLVVQHLTFGGITAHWRDTAAGLGGWTFVTQIALTTLQATGMGFFGLYGSTAALTTTPT